MSGAAYAARGRRGEPDKASPVRALILMGDWCASFKARHPKPDDEDAQPSEFQRPGPVQRQKERG